MIPALVLAGDPEHGVDRHARELAGALGEPVVLQPGPGPRHAHVTDRLWGRDPEAAAARFEALAAGGPLTVTLHDLPQPSDGERSQARRAAAFARVVACAHGVVCSSAHEARLLAAFAPEVRPAVIPLPVIPLAPGAPAALDDEVALLGFFYPGKGHAEAVAAVAQLADPALGVSVLGRASPGHEGELAEVVAAAERRDVRVRVSGYLSEEELVLRARRAAVPLVGHRHVSASGSVGAWIGAGRRPLVPEGPYWRELDALRPGTVTVVAEGELRGAIAAARADPASTWIAAGSSTRPHLDDAAAAYRAWWDGLAW